jgi:Mg-chelatase subunit ChlD
LLRLIAPLAVLLLASAFAREHATAQTPPVSAALSFFEIATLEHDPSGRLVASLALLPETKLELSRLTALVDGQRRLVAEVIQREPQPILVVIALDASGSMQGAPLSSAKQAALDLNDRLNPGDRVVVVSFADGPQVLSAFTTSRGATIESVVAAGTAALYGAVDAAAQLIVDADTDDSVLVLLSDGVDSGLTEVGRAQSIEAIGGSGAAVYSFALQLQGEVDAAYLGEIANRTGGELSQVAGEQALGALFASLGRKLGADVAVTIEVAPMLVGSHLLSLRFLTGVETVQSDFVFDVENAGLLVAAVDRRAENEVSATGSAAESTSAMSTPEAGETNPPPGAGIVIRLNSLVDLDAFDVVVTLGEQEPATLFPGTDRLLVDSWAFAPGPLPVVLQAFLPGTDELVAETSLSVQIPEPEPVPTLRRSDQEGSRVLLATGRVQGVTAPILRMFIDGDEIGIGRLTLVLMEF